MKAIKIKALRAHIRFNNWINFADGEKTLTQIFTTLTFFLIICFTLLIIGW